MEKERKTSIKKYREGNSTSNDIFLKEGVVDGCGNAIEKAFETLILAKGEKPYDWYKNLGIDKGNASKIRRGLIIPSIWLKVKIAHYFGVDSSVIWNSGDIRKTTIFEEALEIKRRVEENE